MLHFDFRSCFVAAFSALLSFLPPRSISRWPAFPASDFSVMAVIPEVCFLFAWCALTKAAFLGLMTREPVCLR